MDLAMGIDITTETYNNNITWKAFCIQGYTVSYRTHMKLRRSSNKYKNVMILLWRLLEVNSLKQLSICQNYKWKWFALVQPSATTTCNIHNNKTSQDVRRQRTISTFVVVIVVYTTRTLRTNVYVIAVTEISIYWRQSCIQPYCWGLSITDYHNQLNMFSSHFHNCFKYQAI